MLISIISIIFFTNRDQAEGAKCLKKSIQWSSFIGDGHFVDVGLPSNQHIKDLPVWMLGLIGKSWQIIILNILVNLTI